MQLKKFNIDRAMIEKNMHIYEWSKLVHFHWNSMFHVYFSFNICYFHKKVTPLDELYNSNITCTLRFWLKMEIWSNNLSSSDVNDLIGHSGH